MASFRDYTPSINFPVLLRIIGLLLTIEGAFLLVPLVTCLIYGERDWIWFLLTMGVTVGAGLLLSLIHI